MAEAQQVSVQLGVISNLRRIHIVGIEENGGGLRLQPRPTPGSPARIDTGEILVAAWDGGVVAQIMFRHSLQIKMLGVELAQIVNIDIVIDCAGIIAAKIKESPQRGGRRPGGDAPALTEVGRPQQGIQGPALALAQRLRGIPRRP